MLLWEATVKNVTITYVPKWEFLSVNDIHTTDRSRSSWVMNWMYKKEPPVKWRKLLFVLFVLAGLFVVHGKYLIASRMEDFRSTPKTGLCISCNRQSNAYRTLDHLSLSVSDSIAKISVSIFLSRKHLILFQEIHVALHAHLGLKYKCKRGYN